MAAVTQTRTTLYVEITKAELLQMLGIGLPYEFVRADELPGMEPDGVPHIQFVFETARKPA